MKQFFIQLFILFMFISQVFAQSGSIINDAVTGVQFSIPEGWSGQKTDTGYLLGSNSKKGFILIFYHQYKNLDQIRQEAAQGIVDENGTMLNLEGSLKSISDNGLAGQFSGTIEWQQATAYVASIISPL
jgi:hypothetical protein